MLDPKEEVGGAQEDDGEHERIDVEAKAEPAEVVGVTSQETECSTVHGIGAKETEPQVDRLHSQETLHDQY